MKRIILFAALLVTSFPLSLQAQDSDADATTSSKVPASCDADFMNVVKNKAAAEASREISVAQSVIMRPDSVLEYSCFTFLQNLTANEGASIFSENAHWLGKNIDISSGSKYSGKITVATTAYLGPNSMDDALKSVVTNTLRRYEGDEKLGYGWQNFGHYFLNGSQELRLESTSLRYFCPYMNSIWQIEKCSNFFVPAEVFPPLLTDSDIRTAPVQCDSGTWFSNNGSDKTLIEAQPDLVVTDFKTYRRDAPDAVSCEDSEPFPTGRRVRVLKTLETSAKGETNREEEYYDEKVCTLPGCYFNYESGKCAD